MKNLYQAVRKGVFYTGVWCLASLVLAGCSLFQIPGGQYPGGGGQGNAIAPTLSQLTVSPNPVSAGTIINLIATYSDPDADLQFGVAAVSIDGGNLSRIAFRTVYPSGVLTIPLAVSHYSSPSDLNVMLKIRDSAGNWSNAVSTVLSIR